MRKYNRSNNFQKFISIFFFSLFIIPQLVFADSIEAFFNHNKNHTYTDPYYNRTRIGDNLENILLDAINSAQASISIAVYQLDLPRVAQALAKKKAAGVSVKLILDNSNSKIWQPKTPEEIAKLNDHDLNQYNEFIAFADTNKDGVVSLDEQMNADSLLILKNAGINWIDDTADGSKGTGLMHHKFMIIDNKLLITGSANFTRSCIHGDLLHPDSKGNANSMLRIQNQNIIDFFNNEFSEMWDNHHFGPNKKYRGPKNFNINGSNITIQFSPTSKKQTWEESTNGLIAKQFADATVSNDSALFVFSEQKIADAMQAAHENGMVNRTIIETSFATRDYSDLLDILGLQMPSSNCTYRKNSNPWSHPSLESGYVKLDEGDLLHHKFAVIDHHKVIIGSHNWSTAANTQNDEALLVIDDSKIASDYSFEFDNLYSKAITGIPYWLSKKIADDKTKCGL